MEEIILELILVCIFLILLIVFFLLTVKRVNVLTKNVFLNKLQEYDFLTKDKENKIQELNDEIKNKEIDLKKINEIIELNKEKSKIKDRKEKEVQLPVDKGYVDKSISKKYKQIKNKFNFDEKKIIKDFIKDNTVINDNYETYTNIRKKLSTNAIYKISCYKSDDQIKIITELLDDNEFKIIKKYIVEGFSIIKFSNKLNELLIVSDPKIEIWVGDRNKDYSLIDKNIVMVYDDKITEGFRLIYKGIIHDYSI